MTPNSRTDPKQTVLDFAFAYSEWETLMDLTDDEFSNVELREQFHRILDDFCTKKRRVYVDCMPCFSRPPVYAKIVDENIAKVEVVNKSRVHVDTIQLDFHAYRFVVLRKADGWRIDSVKWRTKKDTDWRNTLIGS